MHLTNTLLTARQASIASARRPTGSALRPRIEAGLPWSTSKPGAMPPRRCATTARPPLPTRSRTWAYVLGQIISDWLP
jgi:hypothetical protein